MDHYSSVRFSDKARPCRADGFKTWQRRADPQNEGGGGDRRRFCRGWQCGLLLSPDHFAANSNTADGLNLYCMACNTARRQQKAESRQRRDTDTVGAGNNVIDKFEQFKLYYQRGEILQQFVVAADKGAQAAYDPGTEDCEDRRRWHTDAVAAIVAALRAANVEVIADRTREVFCDLFTARRFVCVLDDQPHALRLECFARHAHVVCVNRDNMEISVSGCTLKPIQVVKFEEAQCMLREMAVV